MEELTISNCSILVVDDTQANLLLLDDLLELAGFDDVRLTSDPTEVVGLVEDRTPDLILLDIRMPVMNGFDVMQALEKRFGNERPLIMVLTAQTDIPTRTRALALGAIDFLTKPFDHFEVIQRIKNILRYQQQSRLGPNSYPELSELLSDGTKTDGEIDLSLTDPISSLPNRRALLVDILKRIAQREQISIFYIELHGFDRAVRSYGHEIAEGALRSIAQTLQSSRLSKTIKFGHWSSSQFLGITGKLDEVDGENLARRITKLITGHHQMNDIAVYFSSRIGVNLSNDGLSHADELVRRAALAVPSAQGRTAHSRYDKDLDERIARENRIVSDLPRSLARNELELHYQPKVCLKTGRLTGAEGLARWKHPTLGWISPFEFITLAERTGQIAELGRWVLDTGFKQLKEWLNIKQVGPDFVLALNVSVDQITRPGFVSKVRWLLEHHEIDGEQIQLEVTESMLIENFDEAVSVLRELRALKISIALDDFGTGYSSLSYMRELPLDVLKIDRAFVSDALESATDRSLIESIVSIGHAFKLKLVAEGIETRDQASLLSKMKCETGQGYFFSRPLPASEFPVQTVPKGQKGAKEKASSAGLFFSKPRTA